MKKELTPVEKWIKENGQPPVIDSGVSGLKPGESVAPKVFKGGDWLKTDGGMEIRRKPWRT